MSTFKDITYKKNHDETWTEWSKRVPDNDEDKLDYIEDTIYEYCQWGGERTREMTDMMLQMGVEDLILLLDSEHLLHDEIERAYLDIRAAEKMNPTCNKKYKEEEEEEEECEQCGKTEKDCITKGMMFDTGCLSIYAVDNRLLCPDCIPSFDNDEEEEHLYPVKTITVAEMIASLSKLPPDAKLVMTESGFYSKSDFAEVMLPIQYTVKNDGFPSDLPTGTEVYIIGHSHQSYL